MKVKILLENNETQYEAEESLVKAITGKYDNSKIPHPDPVVNELTLKFQHEYNKQLVAMMSEIFEVIKYKDDLGKSLESLKNREPKITKEMIDYSDKRLAYHIERCKTNMLSIVDQTDVKREDAEKRGEDHDELKFTKEEREHYIWVDEFYRRNSKDKKWDYPKSLKTQVRKATKHHISNSAHHPESHKDINDMTNLDILEMVCDWQAISDERKETGCRGWADSNVGKRWKFNEERTKQIYKYISLLEGRSTSTDIKN